jgi:hypothetical protein
MVFVLGSILKFHRSRHIIKEHRVSVVAINLVVVYFSLLCCDILSAESSTGSETNVFVIDVRLKVIQSERVSFTNLSLLAEFALQ